MRTTTTNGAAAHSTTYNSCLNLFASIGASRSNQDGIKNFFITAFKENPLYATAILAYARDIRNGGCGERQTYRTLIKEIINLNKDFASKLCELTPVLGRWDDLKAFYGTIFEKKASTIWADAILREDVLAAKWAKREDKVLQKALNMNEAKLRRTLSSIRKNAIPEAKMCSNLWDEIDYSAIPSICGMRSANAFKRHDAERYDEFINSKETKVNASVSWPHDIYRMYAYGNNASSASKYWANLPAIDGIKNVLPVVDVSGSMTCKASGEITCMDVAISLGTYLSQQNKGVFHNRIVTFSAEPSLVTIPDTVDISNIFSFVKRINWGMTTDIQKVYELILKAAIVGKAKQSDLPEYILILSD